MVENLKELCSKMDSKSEFVEQVASYYKMNTDYISHKWFQSKWSIPESKQGEIVSMAQIYLYNQIKKTSNILEKTGFQIK